MYKSYGVATALLLVACASVHEAQAADTPYSVAGSTVIKVEKDNMITGNTFYTVKCKSGSMNDGFEMRYLTGRGQYEIMGFVGIGEPYYSSVESAIKGVCR